MSCRLPNWQLSPRHTGPRRCACCAEGLVGRRRPVGDGGDVLC